MDNPKITVNLTEGDLQDLTRYCQNEEEGPIFDWLLTDQNGNKVNVIITVGDDN